MKTLYKEKPQFKKPEYRAEEISAYAWAFNKRGEHQACLDWLHTFLSNTENRENTMFFIAGLEYGDSQGQAHIQCYILFKRPYTRYFLHRQFPGVAIEAMQVAIEGPYRNYEYCTKQNLTTVKIGDIYIAQEFWNYINQYHPQEKLDFRKYLNI